MIGFIMCRWKTLEAVSMRHWRKARRKLIKEL